MMRDIYSAEELTSQLNDSRQEVQDLTLDLTEAQEAYQAISQERDRLANEVQEFQKTLDSKEKESEQALTHFNEQLCSIHHIILYSFEKPYIKIVF